MILPIVKENYFVLTGAMGAGKSAILEMLKEKYLCIDEPARIILKQQRAVRGDGVPEENPVKFNNLMLEKMICDYNENVNRNEITIFDRGIPDNIGYAELLNTPDENPIRMAEKFRYNENIFLFEGWEKIYTNDDERKADFRTASNFGSVLKKIYIELNYNIILVPNVSINERCKFLIQNIESMCKT